MSEPQPVGDVLSGLGATVELDSGSLVSGALVLLSVVGPDGRPQLHICHAGLTWSERLGLLDAAHRLELRSAIGDGG